MSLNKIVYFVSVHAGGGHIFAKLQFQRFFCVHFSDNKQYLQRALRLILSVKALYLQIL